MCNEWGSANGERDNKCAADARTALINQVSDCNERGAFTHNCDFMNELSARLCPEFEALTFDVTFPGVCLQM